MPVDQPIIRFEDDNFFLSNFFAMPQRLVLGTPTVEHFYQSCKTIDPAQRGAVLAAHSPGQAKRRGRQVTLRADWEDVKDITMRIALLDKFAPGTRMAAKLDSTGGSILIEGNHWHDNYWGNCNCQECADIPGLNKLGAQLMRIRQDNREY
jgi:ribA/ribD-fused uncharacterized protein